MNETSSSVILNSDQSSCLSFLHSLGTTLFEDLYVGASMFSFVSLRRLFLMSRHILKSIMFSLCLYIFLLRSVSATNHTPIGEQGSSPLTDDFNNFVLQTLDHWHVPGLAIAVVNGNETFSKVPTFPSGPLSPPVADIQSRAMASLTSPRSLLPQVPSFTPAPQPKLSPPAPWPFSSKAPPTPPLPSPGRPQFPHSFPPTS